MPTDHGRVERERSPDGDEADGNWGTTDGDRAGGSADRGLRELSDIAGAGDPGDIMVTSVEVEPEYPMV